MSRPSSHVVAVAVAIAAAVGVGLGALFGDRLHVQTPCAPLRVMAVPASWVSNIGQHFPAENDVLIVPPDVRALLRGAAAR